MAKKKALLQKARRHPASLSFRDLEKLARNAGYELRDQEGSHRLYRNTRSSEAADMTFQEGKGGSAKAYQVRQLVSAIDAHGLMDEEEEVEDGE